MRKFIVYLSTDKEVYTEKEIVEDINDQYNTDYLTFSDIPKDLLEEYFIECTNYSLNLNIKEKPREE